MADSLLVTIVGGATSNSLCSLTEADAYIAGSLYADKATWAGLEESEQESLLILAGLAFNGMNWAGWKCYTNQAMCFPRWKDPDPPQSYRKPRMVLGPFPHTVEYGYMFDDEDTLFTAATALMPDNIKKAQAYYAYDVIYRAIQNRTSPAVGPASDALNSISLFGDVSISWNQQLNVGLADIGSLTGLLRARSPEIYLLLQDWVCEYMSHGHSRFEPTLLDAVA